MRSKFAGLVSSSTQTHTWFRVNLSAMPPRYDLKEGEGGNQVSIFKKVVVFMIMVWAHVSLSARSQNCQ